MEDAATAEISRSQLWQWIRHQAKTDQGQVVTTEWVLKLTEEEFAKIKKNLGEEGFKKSKFDLAKKRFLQTLDQSKFEEFLTLICYDDIVVRERNPSSKL